MFGLTRPAWQPLHTPASGLAPLSFPCCFGGWQGDGDSGRDDYSKQLRDRETYEFDLYVKRVADADPNAAGLYNHVFRYLEG